MASGDLFYNNVSLLLHMDGTDGSTTFTDDSPVGNTITAGGNAQIDTAYPDPFANNTGVLLLDGSGDYLEAPTDTMDLTGEMCFEAWFNVANLSASWEIMGTRYYVSGYYFGFQFLVKTNGALNFFGYRGTTNATPVINITATTAISSGEWHHAAVSRDSGGVWRLFLDGNLEVSATESTNIVLHSSSNKLVIGSDNSRSDYFNGYIDEARVTKGVVRYTESFAAPSEPFPNNVAWAISGALTETLTATEFILYAIKVSDGTFVGYALVTGTTYTLTVLTNEPVMLIMFPNYGDIWIESTPYAVDDLVFPTDPETTPYYYIVTAGGTSGATEPTWPTVPGNSVTQDGITYQCVERLATPDAQGPLIPA